jgi:phage terminase small subunit
MSDPSPIPVPPDPKHQRFADLVLAGKDQVDAYLGAGFASSRRAARGNAARLRKSAPVAAYIQAIQDRAAQESLLSVLEIRRFCARVVRVPLPDLNPSAGGANADLIKSYAASEGGTRIEKLDPFKAIEIDLKLSGQDPETNALRDLSAALAQLGGSPIPSDRM